MPVAKKKRYSESPSGKHSIIVLEGSGKFAELRKFSGKIEEAVGCQVEFMATWGHFLATDPDSLGITIDVENRVFEPDYIPEKGRKSDIADMKSRIKACLASWGKILLMTDKDRAGDHIAWEVVSHFGLKDGDWLRAGITTPKERDFMESISQLKPELHTGRIESDRARMVLDKCFGYVQSPHLWKRVKDIKPEHVAMFRKATETMLDGFKSANAALLKEKRVKDFVDMVEGMLEETDKYAADKGDILRTSVGRVQVPMLRLVVETFIDSFGKIKVLNNIRVTDANGFNWKFSPEAKEGATAETAAWSDEDEGISTDVDVDAVYAAIWDKKTVKVTGLSVRKRSSKPPKPYNDASFSSEGNSILRIAPKTLADVAQKLYESALTTYYRSKYDGYTDSSHDDVKNYVKAAGFALEERKYPLEKDASHDAIHTAYSGTIVLGNDNLFEPAKWPLRETTADHRTVFDLVYRRTLATMMPDFQSDEVSLVGEIAGYRFELEMNEVTDEGFTKAFHWYLSGVRNRVTAEIRAKYAVSSEIEIMEVKLEKGKFKFSSESTYDAFRSKLEKRRISTSATFVPIFENIKKKEYIVHKEKDGKIRVTPKGWFLYALMQKYGVFSLDLTDEIEEGLEKLEKGKVKYADFLSDTFKKFFLDGGYWEFYQGFLKNGSGSGGNKGEETGEKCPKCGAPVIMKKGANSKTGKEYTLLECSKRKYDYKTKKISGCEYYEWK